MRVEVERPLAGRQGRRERGELHREDQHDPDDSQLDVSRRVECRPHLPEEAAGLVVDSGDVDERQQRGGQRQADGSECHRATIRRDRPERKDRDQGETPEKQDRREVGPWSDVEPLLEVRRHRDREIAHKRHHDTGEAKANRRPHEREVQIREDDRKGEQKQQECGVEPSPGPVHRGEQDCNRNNRDVGEDVDEQVVRAQVDEVGGECSHRGRVRVLEGQRTARLDGCPVDSTEDERDEDDGNRVDRSQSTPERSQECVVFRFVFVIHNWANLDCFNWYPALGQLPAL